MRFLLLIVQTFLLSIASLSAKTLIMTHSYNRPEFISWQYQTLQKFVEGEFEFVVFNDAPNEELFNQIERICRQLSISSIPVPQEIHSLPYLYRGQGVCGPSAECAETIQYIFNTLGFKYPGAVMVLDSDMFLIRRLNIEEFLCGNDIAAPLQQRKGSKGVISYFLPNLLIFNMESLPDKAMFNFGLGEIDGVRTDTGGFNHFYIQQHPQLKWRHLDVIYPSLSANPPYPEVVAQFKPYKAFYRLLTTSTYDYEFYGDYHFLHFTAGSNWNKHDDHYVSKKTELFIEGIEELLSSEL